MANEAPLGRAGRRLKHAVKAIEETMSAVNDGVDNTPPTIVSGGLRASVVADQESPVSTQRSEEANAQPATHEGMSLQNEDRNGSDLSGRFIVDTSNTSTRRINPIVESDLSGMMRDYARIERLHLWEAHDVAISRFLADKEVPPRARNWKPAIIMPSEGKEPLDTKILSSTYEKLYDYAYFKVVGIGEVVSAAFREFVAGRNLKVMPKPQKRQKAK